MPFRTALSGLNAAAAELRVIGHNIANSATTGFKKSRAEFADIFATSSLGVTSNAIGSGVRIASVSQQFSQGNIGFTDNNLDLAVSGQGFFIVSDGGVNSYTRAGQFGVDRDGFVVNNAGSRLQIFQADLAGNITGARGDLQLDTSDISPQATSLVDFGVNLDASSTVPVTAVATSQVDLVGSLDADDAAGAIYTMAPFNVYDSYGAVHTATITYTQGTVDSEWNMSLDIDGAFTNNHTINFDSQGVLSMVDGAVPNASRTVAMGSFDPGTGADPVQITASLIGLSATSDGVTGTGNVVTPTVVNNTAQVYEANLTGALDGDHVDTEAVALAQQTYTDSLGNTHTLDLTYTKTANANEWTLTADIDSGAQTQNYTLVFNPGGVLATIDGAAATVQNLSFAPGAGAAEMIFDIDATAMTETTPDADKLDDAALIAITDTPADYDFDLAGTLDANDVFGGPTYSPATFDLTDSEGNTHTATVTYTHNTNANEWNMNVSIAGGAAAYSQDYTMVFDADGALATIDGAVPGVLNLPAFNPADADAAEMAISFDPSTMTAITDGANGNAAIASANVNGSSQSVFDASNANTYNSSTSLTIFDSLGSSHLATTYYRKTPIPNQWETYTFVDGTQVDGPSIMEFSPLGTIITPAAPAQIAVAAFAPGGGAANISMTLDYSDATQFGSNFSVNALEQDGFTTGRLSGIDIADTGVITSRFTNGQSRSLGQVALANFANSQGLRQLGDTTWAESFESGAALVSAPGSGSLGAIQSGALEGSNVDLTEQLVGMITAQRNFQANAQVITTADTITQTIINIR